jgi:hypothetical protein
LEAGVNQTDVAPTSSEAELRVGPWLARHRHEIFLGCRTRGRTKDGAAKESRRSLERLPYTTWYEPHDQQEAIDQAVWFVLSQPGVTAIASSGDTRILNRILDSVRRMRQIGAAEQEHIAAAADPAHTVFV